MATASGEHVQTPAVRAGAGVMSLPEVNVAIFAFLLNYPWEFLQVPFFAEMATAPHWDAVRFCTRATLGDVGIALVSFWAVAAIARSRDWILRPTLRQVVAFAAGGIAITVAFEWLATEVWGRWAYGAAMPTVPLLGTGILPLLQWAILPPLIVWFVRRQLT